MALNASGPISIAGTTAGVSIQVELGGTGTSQMSLNCASVRTLAGVPTGAIVMPTNFWGKSNTIPFGCATYTTAGTYSFVVPTGASKICVVCVGGGGAGYSQTCSCYAGGGGGALSYTNCIPTTPGETLTVTVGAAGTSPLPAVGGGPTSPGGTSSVARSATILISAQGGSGVPLVGTNPGGQASSGVGAVKNNGGNSVFAGGGGAGGYSGNGGNGGLNPSATPGSGGGGGGGGASGPFSNTRGSGGGGVGLIVAGPSGAVSSGGGSGGAPGGPPCGRIGGAAGGGTGGHADSSSQPGSVGGVRIIYGGVGKTYPNNSAP
jgi:hypothetical protein